THYFGFIFALAIVAVLIARNMKARKDLCLLLLGILLMAFVLIASWTAFAWPALSRQTGGQSWLVFAPLDAARSFAYLLFPYWYAAGILALIGFLPYRAELWKLPLFRFAVFVIAVGVAIAVLVSFHTPVLEGRTLAVFGIPAMVVACLCFSCLIEFVLRLLP